MSQPNHAQLIEFIHAEARLLNAGHHDAWLALFAHDGHYWVPLQGAQQVDAQHHNSIAYEDRLLLSLRIERLKNPRVFSQQGQLRIVLKRVDLLNAQAAHVAIQLFP